MFNSITNFIADVKAGYVAARDEAYTSTTTTTIYDSKVKQYTHNAAVAVLKAWKWFYTQCAKAHETIRSCVAKSPVVSAIVMPAVVVVAGLVAGAVCGIVGSMTALVLCVLAEIAATVYVSYMLCAPVISMIKTTFTNEYVRMAAGFATGFAATVCVMAYKALLIAIIL